MSESADTRLGRFVRAEAGAADRSGIYALPIAEESFAARVLLARAAERSLDVQYYIWRGDTTGTLLLEELWNAAERGVRVRLLLDDNGIAGLDATIAALDGHRNIEVRLFNPFPNRRWKPFGYLTDFRRLNRRMHNKSFTADSVATIVGGRNIGDEYFDFGQGMTFADLDVLAFGHVARDVNDAFDRYWNADAVRPAETVIRKAPSNAAPAMLARFAAVRESAAAIAYVGALRATRLIEALLAHDLQLDWTRARLVCDPPGKAQGSVPDADLVFASIREALGSPERAIDLVSPYFVPGTKGTAALAGYAKRGIALRVLTNSLAATNHVAVHAGYARRRRALLCARAELYELKPGGKGPGQAAGSGGSIGSSSATLHAKTFVVDRARVFVGSLNFDPRSIRLNTEMGLVIESPKLAEAIANELDRITQHEAYKVALVPGHRELEWVELTAPGERHYGAEPKTSFGKRIGVRLLALLPIEWLL